MQYRNASGFRYLPSIGKILSPGGGTHGLGWESRDLFVHGLNVFILTAYISEIQLQLIF